MTSYLHQSVIFHFHIAIFITCPRSWNLLQFLRALPFNIVHRVGLQKILDPHPSDVYFKKIPCRPASPCYLNSEMYMGQHTSLLNFYIFCIIMFKFRLMIPLPHCLIKINFKQTPLPLQPYFFAVTPPPICTILRALRCSSHTYNLAAI